MSGGDGTGSSIQVSGAKCAWVPVATSYHVRLDLNGTALNGPGCYCAYLALESP
jgi:hypothetical protein